MALQMFVNNTNMTSAEANQFMNKEGLPSSMDGAVDGAIDTEVNKYEKDF